MKTAIVAGASGLIGRELVQKLIKSYQYHRIYILARKKSGLVHPIIRELVIDFDKISELKFDEPIDDVFCTLGTTMKQAGSREQFKKVDFEYIIAIANLGKQAGAKKFMAISSMGADSKSSFYYNKIKGMTEDSLIKIGFDQLVILRPSLLLGERPQRRLTEWLSGFFMKVLSFLIPDNYKAIKAEKVADYMMKIASKPTGTVSIVKSGEIRQS